MPCKIHTLIQRHANPAMDDCQDNCFKLIGYDSSVTMRKSGEISTISINYLLKGA